MPRPLQHSHCTVEGCGRPHKAQGYCASHYLQFRRNGAVKALQERAYDWGGTCCIKDCTNPQHTKGFCKMHYQRWKRHGDPTVQRKADK